LRRNALVALGNCGGADDAEVRDVLHRYADGDDEVLAEHAAWALAQVEARA
jgi:epoxyqueuosine reductase QueG